MSEIKLLRIVFLTLVMYGFISFLQWGTFLVPLPAFEMVILGICLFFAVRESKSDKRLFVLFLLAGVAQFLGREYNFAFILSDEQMYPFIETMWLDLIYILSALTFGIIFILQSLKEKWNRVLIIGLVTLLIASYLIPYTWMVALPLSIICLVHLQKNSLLIKHHSIWAYLLLFVASRELTLHLL